MEFHQVPVLRGAAGGQMTEVGQDVGAFRLAHECLHATDGVGLVRVHRRENASIAKAPQRIRDLSVLRPVARRREASDEAFRKVDGQQEVLVPIHFGPAGEGKDRAASLEVELTWGTDPTSRKPQ